MNRGLLLILISAGVFAHAAISEKNFTAEQLQGTASYLGLRIQKPKTKFLPCDPDAATAKAWMGGSLHSLIDEKVKAEVGHFKNNPAQMVKRARGCARACACSLYADMLSASEDDMGKHPAYKQISAGLKKDAKREDPVACAKKLKWFCGSELEQFLRGTSPESSPTPRASDPKLPSGQNSPEE